LSGGWLFFAIGGAPAREQTRSLAGAAPSEEASE